MDSVPFIDLACRRSAGQIIRSTLRLYGDYPWLFLVLAAAVVAPWELVRLAVTGGGPFGHIHHESFLERQSLTLIDLLISPLISAMHVHAVAVIGERQHARLGSSGRRAAGSARGIETKLAVDSQQRMARTIAVPDYRHTLSRSGPRCSSSHDRHRHASKRSSRWHRGQHDHLLVRGTRHCAPLL